MKTLVDKVVGNRTLREFLLAVLVYCMLIFKSWEHRDSYAGGITEYLFENGITWFVILSLIYINHLFLIPKLFEPKKYLSYGMLLLATIITASYLQDLHCGCNAVKAKFFYYLLTTGIGMAALIYNRYVKREATIRESELLQRKMELNHLKAQVNPHFLFNALNSLYVLSRQNDNTTSEVVMQLSQLLRYQLESSQQQIVSLKEELKFIHNYLMLEELRLGNRSRIEFEIEGEQEGYFIAPMLLIPFVENAFKHGVNNSRQQSQVTVSATISGKIIEFTVVNSKDATVKTPPAVERKSKLGLQNVKKRLSILYPSHQLTIRELDEQFEVKLQLTLVQKSKLNTIQTPQIEIK